MDSFVQVRPPHKINHRCEIVDVTGRSNAGIVCGQFATGQKTSTEAAVITALNLFAPSKPKQIPPLLTKKFAMNNYTSRIINIASEVGINKLYNQEMECFIRFIHEFVHSSLAWGYSTCYRKHVVM